MELNLDHGIDVPLRRPVNDFGETTYPREPTRTLRVAYLLNPPTPIRSDAGGNSYTQDGRLYVYRSEDIVEGDKVELPEGNFVVLGRASNDHVHPMDGTDFGVKRLHIERG